MSAHQTASIRSRQWLWSTLAVLLLYLHAFAQVDTVQTNVPRLRGVYAHDFYIGCLLSYRHIGFPDDPYVPGQSSVVARHGGELIEFHMNSMSPGNNMKPQYTVDIAASAAAYNNATSQAARDSIDVHPIIRFNGDLIAQLNWAKRQGFTFRGHTLVWHSQTPAAFFRSGYSEAGPRLTKEKMTERMEHYIREVIRLLHEGWPGLLSAMDVVNEAVLDNGQDRTDSEWFRTFGDNSYIMKAFELTRKYCLAYGETQMKLYYNDYNTHLAAKANGIVRLCGPMFAAGYLDGIGMQEHDALTSPTAEQWIASYQKFDPICHEMAVTELDVTTGYAQPPMEVLRQQANQYGQLFKCFVERSYFSGRGKIISVSKDGLNDQYTFKTNQSSSLWDANNQCKPAFFAVVAVGTYYNGLDSLVARAAALKEEDFSPQSWADFAEALSRARNAMTRNYSYTTSAADTLEAAFVALKASMDALQPASAVRLASERYPRQFSLKPSYPNPFKGGTAISYRLLLTSEVCVRIFDLRGKEVATLVHELQGPGDYVVRFDGSSLPSGTYLCHMKAGDRVETQKLTVVR
ncbi:MAG: endo-1,4-beta-xylanase [bacterium]|jgi:endo-1,4-beta-xylanase|nr:endo-1,4-beta-xylanase [candidate division KSB1 bacterium]MDH7560891.1 endo-1,4-beta-xylanase [bacterium]